MAMVISEVVVHASDHVSFVFVPDVGDGGQFGGVVGFILVFRFDLFHLVFGLLAVMLTRFLMSTVFVFPSNV
jgi:hypothetical protein